MKATMKPVSRFAAIFLLLSIALNAHADYNVAIGAGASANGAWSGASPDVWTPSASGATVSVPEIQTRLATGTPVTITTAGGGAENGDITLSASLAWTTNTALTLTALRNIAVDAPIAATGASAGLNLEHGAGADYTLNNGVKITLSGGSASLSIGGQAYTVINNLGVAGDATTTTLQGMKNNLSGKYALGSDINAVATAGWNAGAGFAPVGNDGDMGQGTTQFIGTFAGLGHTVSNLTINRPAEWYVGMLGWVGAWLAPGGLIRDVGVLNASIVGSEYAGVLAGGGYGDIKNSYVSGSVTGGGDTAGLMGYSAGTVSNSHSSASVTGGGTIGGLVGLNAGTISNSYATGSVVSSGDVVGGLVGLSGGGGVGISNSYATGTVSGINLVGGLIGYSYWQTIANTFATGTVSGTSKVGGLIGLLDDSNVNNSYSSGAVSGSSNAGGLVGFSGVNAGPNNVTSSYWDTQASGQPTSVRGTEKTTAQMKQQATFSGWDFINTWSIVEGQTYPEFHQEAIAAPFLYLTSVTVATSTTATLSATSDGAATGYWIVVARDATAPTAAQVKAGVDYGAVTSVAHGSGAMTANVAATFNVSGLTAGANYDLYLVAEDGSSNLSVATKVQFAIDTAPDAFSFTAQTGVALSTVTTSNTITVAGINSAANISIAGGTYSINGGGYTAVAGTVNNGDTVTLKQTSSGSFSTLTTATLTIGGVAGAFNVTTAAALGVNGACGAANGVTTAFVPSANLCTAGTASAVTAGSPWTWSCNGSGGGTNASCSAPNQATGGGSGRAIVSGGTWVVDLTQSAGFIPTSGHAKSPPSLPPGVSFPYGLFDFTLITGAAGSAATITITYPAAVPAGAVYWKYGPSPSGYNCSGAACATAHWYQMPPAQAVFAGNTVTLTITDGGVGDDDLAANGIIVDPGGLGVPGGAAGIPTLSEWALLMLAGLMGLAGMGAMRRHGSGTPA